MKNLLHVGCGGHHILGQHGFNAADGWREIRLDINPAMHPDIIGTITDMRDILDDSIDAVFSSHNLEHLYAHEVPKALAEFRRVLRDDGFCLIIVPDIQEVAKLVVKGKLLVSAYNSSAGPITPLDMMYGHGASIENGNLYMAHKTAFTDESLMIALIDVGFENIVNKRKNYTLASIAGKSISKFARNVLESFF